MTQRDCKHGQLARVCRICELEAEIAALRAKLDNVCKAIDAGRQDDVSGGFYIDRNYASAIAAAREGEK